MLMQASSPVTTLLPAVHAPFLRPAAAALSASTATGTRAVSFYPCSACDKVAAIGVSTAAASAAAAAARRRRRGIRSGAALFRFRGGAPGSWEAGRNRTSNIATAAVVNLTAEAAKRDLGKPVPVILLSGFLGTGKTTLLKHWLENNEKGSRIGVVVNDVAAVNIDAKLVKQQGINPMSNVETIQLENGCACCSLGDELMVTIHDLVALSECSEPFSCIIVELSGIAEPQRVREMFARAKEDGYQTVVGVDLSKVVTMMDASSFCKDYMEYKRIAERPDLMEGDGGQASDYKVVELLVEQAEAADVVVLNKTDLASKEDLEVTRTMLAALNEKATLCETSFGKVPLSKVMEPATAGTEESGHDHHSHTHADTEHEVSAESHGHDAHGHEAHGHEAHSGGHSHGHAEDAPHDHSHAHSHESGHSHSHDGVECNDPHCSDHGHDHAHAHTTTAEERFGISSFTYRARRPFSADRLGEMLGTWPEPTVDCLGELMDAKADVDPDFDMPLSRVIRSKGFAWLNNFPSSRMYWSHAGKHMLLNYEGVWWGAMSKEQLKMVRELASAEYERARKEDWHEEWADRRQEIVFIGQRMDEAAIRALLDKCLVTDEELGEYRVLQQQDQEELDAMWAQRVQMDAAYTDQR